MSKSPFLCITSLDQMPAFWDRRVIFIANVLSMFFGNQEEVRALRREVEVLESYGGRLLPVVDLIFTRKENLLVLEKRPDETLIQYFHSLGLTLPETCVLPKDFEDKFLENPNAFTPLIQKLGAHPAEWLRGYVTDKNLVLLAKMLGKKTIGTLSGCRRGNNKLQFHHFLEKNRMPVFDSFEAASIKEVTAALETLRTMGYGQAVVKAQIGASGIGMFKIGLSSPIAPDAIPSYLFFEGPVLVQGWLDGSLPSVEFVASPSVQIFLDKGTSCVYDLTEQILSQQSVHEGNIAPPLCVETYPEIRDRVVAQAHKIGEWVVSQGYVGAASIDFHVIKRDGVIEIRACEVNARVTGATYPAVLARHLKPGHFWLMRNLRFSRPLLSSQILEKLENERILFKKDSAEGILPINLNAASEGNIVKGQFLFLASKRAGLQAMQEKMASAFALDAHYDRD